MWIIKKVIYGIFIGFGFLVPGISGGTLAVIFGVYDELLSLLVDIKKNILSFIRYVFLLSIGGIIGVLISSFFMDYLITNNEKEMYSFFIGAIVGSIPILYRNAIKEGRHRNDGFIFISSVISSSFLLMWMYRTLSVVDLSHNPLIWIFSGFLIGLGILLPGISPSNIFVMIGNYGNLITEIKNLNILVGIQLLLGLILSFILLLSLIKFIYERYYSSLSFFILGIVISSLFYLVFIFLRIENQNSIAVYLFFAVGCMFSYKMT